MTVAVLESHEYLHVDMFWREILHVRQRFGGRKDPDHVHHA